MKEYIRSYTQGYIGTRICLAHNANEYNEPFSLTNDLVDDDKCEIQPRTRRFEQTRPHCRAIRNNMLVYCSVLYVRLAHTHFN